MAEMIDTSTPWKLMDLLNFMRRGGETKRFHTELTLRENTVAQHSHGVAMLCWLLSGAPGSVPSGHLLMAALVHDLAEWQVGDIPAPAKRRFKFGQEADHAEHALLEYFGMNFQLTDHEQRLLKIADAMDGLLFLIRERSLGNRALTNPWQNFQAYTIERVNALAPAERRVPEQILSAILQMWEQVDV